VTGPGVVWITGLSGAGKSTVARLVRDRLTELGTAPVLLDGDRMRAILPVEFGYEEAERRKLAFYYARLARELAGQGHLVLCATVSLFHDVQAWNRAHTPGYLEVWLRVPVEVLGRREGRAAFYGAGGAPALRNVVGVETPAAFPVAADLVIDNFGDVTPQVAAARIVAALAVRSAG
jgi:cytidine diphosphoramidate kinase